MMIKIFREYNNILGEIGYNSEILDDLYRTKDRLEKDILYINKEKIDKILSNVMVILNEALPEEQARNKILPKRCFLESVRYLDRVDKMQFKYILTYQFGILKDLVRVMVLINVDRDEKISINGFELTKSINSSIRKVENEIMVLKKKIKIEKNIFKRIKLFFRPNLEQLEYTNDLCFLQEYLERFLENKKRDEEYGDIL